MEVLKVVDEARGQVVGDAVDEDFVSGWAVSEFMMKHPCVRLESHPKSTILT